MPLIVWVQAGCASKLNATRTSIGLAPVTPAVYASTCENCGRLAGSSLTWTRLVLAEATSALSARLQGEQPPTRSQGWQPVCRSNPINGELMTPRTSIMSVPGRTGIEPFNEVIVVPAGTLSYGSAPPAPTPARFGSEAFKTA